MAVSWIHDTHDMYRRDRRLGRFLGFVFLDYHTLSLICIINSWGQPRFSSLLTIRMGSYCFLYSFSQCKYFFFVENNSFDA